MFFVFVNMGHYASQNCQTLLLPQIAPVMGVLKILLIFCLQYPHKFTFRIFDILTS